MAYRQPSAQPSSKRMLQACTQAPVQSVHHDGVGAGLHSMARLRPSGARGWCEA